MKLKMRFIILHEIQIFSDLNFQTPRLRFIYLHELKNALYLFT